MKRVMTFLGAVLLLSVATHAQAQDCAALNVSRGNLSSRDTAGAPVATGPLSPTARLGGVAEVLPASFVSVKTSAQNCAGVQCNSSGSGCGQYSYYRPCHRSHFNRSYSCGRSHCGGYRYRHHGCYCGCR